MRFTLWISSLWPGCWHAWQLGQWRGLALATAFAMSLNAALVTTFVWPEWLGIGTSPAANAAICWLLVLGLWSAGFVWLWREGPRLARTTDNRGREALDARFQQAQHEYLKGHWIEAETLLLGLLGGNPRDVEARLLLASVQRRTSRWNEARKTLHELIDDDAAGRWRMEMETELERIDELENETNTKAGGAVDDGGELSRAA